MENIYYQLKNVLTGKDSFDFFKISIALILVYYIFMMIEAKYNIITKHLDSKKFKFNKKIKRDSLIVPKFLLKMMIFIGCIYLIAYIIDAVYMTENCISILNDYIFVIFLISCYITYKKIINSTNLWITIDNVIDLNDNKLDDYKISKIKNSNELLCNSYLLNTKNEIRVAKVKLEILKHFLGPVLLAPCISLLAPFISKQQVPNFIYEVLFIFILIVLILFYTNFKLIKSYYDVCYFYEEAFYKIRHKIFYTEEEIIEIREKRKEDNKKLW